MHVYIENGEKQCCLFVQFVEGHIPKISNLSSDDTRLIREKLEPAIWFKVMVLESVRIDCLKRVFCWTNGMKDKAGLPITNMVYGADLCCYDFDDDVDELFKLGIFLIEKNPLSEPNEEKRPEQMVEYEQAVIRMLHCYILRKVTLQPCDMDSVGNALTSQLKSIAQLEDNSLVHLCLAEHYLTQLRNIRELEILPVLEQLVEDGMVNEDFLNVLHGNIKKIEPNLRQEVNIAQEKVAELKTQIANENSQSLSQKLEEAQRERNQIHQNLMDHLVAKELIRNVLSSQYFNDEITMNENCCRYMNIHNRMMSEKSISKSTMYKKIRAVSVRECIKYVINELEEGQDTTGDEETVDGKIVTDVMIGESRVPEWQTLNQRLSSIVYNRGHPVGLAFYLFCEKTETSYRDLLRAVEMFARNTASFVPSSGDFYIVSEDDLGLNKVYLEKQRNDISTHIYQVTFLLSETFQNISSMFVRKIRLCYERCFYQRIGSDLILLYRTVYSESLHSLTERISKLKEIKISKLGLKLKSEWWVQLFETEKNETSNENSCSIEDKKNDFIDKEDCSDLDEDEYNEPTHLDNHLGYTKGMKAIKAWLQLGRDKIYSRASDNLFDLEDGVTPDIAKMKNELAQKERTEQAGKERRNFDTNGMLEDEVSLVSIPGKPTGRNRSNNVLSIRFGRPNRKDKQKTLLTPDDTFDLHFGQAIKTIKNVFRYQSPLKKMQCLTLALWVIANKVEELRMRGRDVTFVDRGEVALTADDVLSLLVLVLLKLAPHDAAKLYVDLLFVSDLMADFLSSGCHSYALCEFKIAFRVLDQTCDVLSI